MPHAAMFRGISGQSWVEPIRRGITLGLLGLAVGLTSGSTPSRAGDDAPLPFESIYVPETSVGVVVVHPAKLARELGTTAPVADLVASLNALFLDIQETIANNLCDVPAPIARLRLDIASIETVVVGFETKIAQTPSQVAGQPDRVVASGSGAGFTVRTVAPFDWLTWLRSLPLSLRAVQDGDKTYYTIVIPQSLVSWDGHATLNFALTIPDDRTLVVNTESWIKSLVHRQTPAAPKCLRGEAWPQICQGMVALAVDNTDDALIKGLGPIASEPEISLVIARLQGIERIMAGVDADAAGALTLHAEGLIRDEALARSMAASFGLYALLGRAGAAIEKPDSPADVKMYRLVGQICKQAQIAASGRSVSCTVPNFLSRDDLAALLSGPAGTVDPAVQPARIDHSSDAVPAAPQAPEPPPAPQSARLLPPALP